MEKLSVSNGNFVKKFRQISLVFAFMLILFCFLISNDQYGAYAFVNKNRLIASNKEIARYQNDSESIPVWVTSTPFLNGGDLCANATQVNTLNYTDTGNTTGANNTINVYNRPDLPFPYPGPDVYYKIIMGSPGTIAATMNLSGSTLDGVLFLTNVCPAGTGNTIPAANALGNSQDVIGGGGGPENLPATTVPAGTYFIGVDSFYGSGAASAGPYSITITTTLTSAADVSVGGRVTDTAGNGIRGANVSATDINGQVLNVVTNSFGYYKFENLSAGDLYIFQVSARKTTFSNPIQTVSPSQNISDLNFTAID